MSQKRGRWLSLLPWAGVGLAVIASVGLAVYLSTKDPESGATEKKISQSSQERRVATVPPAASIPASREYLSNNILMRRVRDSLEQEMLDIIHTTYPAPNLTRTIKSFVIEADTSAYCGIFYGSVPNPRIALTVGLLTGWIPDYWSGRLSHEMGHFFSPDHQARLAGQHADTGTLNTFTRQFRDAYDHDRSIGRDTMQYIRELREDRRAGRITEEEFFNQYVAEAFSCYFEYCRDAHGRPRLSEEETKIIDKYVEVLGGGLFDRSAMYMKRLELEANMAEQLEALKRGYRKEKK